MWDLRSTNSRELFKVLGTTGGPPGSRSRHLGIKRPMLTIILYSLDSENPIFIGFCVQCVPWLSRNVRDEIRDFSTRSWRPRFNNGQRAAGDHSSVQGNYSGLSVNAGPKQPRPLVENSHT